MATKTYTAEETAKLKALYAKLAQFDDTTIPKARDTGGQALTDAINQRNSIAREITSIQNAPAIVAKGAPLPNRVGAVTQDTAASAISNDAPVPAAGEELSTTEQGNLNNAANPQNGEAAGVNDQGQPLDNGGSGSGRGSGNGSSSGAGAIQTGNDAANPYTDTGKTPDATIKKPLPNVLHNYAGYTYGISLHLLTAAEYNDVMKNQTFLPNRVLVASAGKYNNTPGPTQFIRSSYFNDDFYFDNLSIETLIGYNERSRASNAVGINFTLIEPYGFTFINRLIDQCNDPEVNCKNYLDMPYLLQIDFYGMDDAGEIIGLIPNTTKKIPIRFLTMDVKVSTKGAEYTIEAGPYGHIAFDHSYGEAPANFEIQARTVAQFFQSIESAGGATDTTTQREGSNATLWRTNDGRLVGPDGQYTSLTEINASLISAKSLREIGLLKSFGSAINDYNKDLYIKNKIGVNDRYFFKFDSEIGNSEFTNDSVTAPKDTGMVDPNKLISIKQADLGKNTDDYDPTLRIFQINAGSAIDKLIVDVVRMSDFMQNQVNIPDGQDPEVYLRKKAAMENKPFYWIKIVPSIVLGAYDNVRKVWQRDITYHVQRYEIRNLKMTDIGPQAKAEYPVKEYNYIYTGKNDDVLDFDITFNCLYYNAMTFYRDALADIYNTPNYTEQSNSNNPDSYDGVLQNNNTIMPMAMKSQVIDAQSRANSGSITAKQVAVADLERSLMNSYGADMMDLKLTIIGDPQFIKQDDLFYIPNLSDGAFDSTTNTSDDPRLVANGSLSMDTGEVYVLVKFRTPEDVDESTGLMRFGKYDSSLFSGFYQVLTVMSTFRQGQFMQQLEMVRIPTQDKFDYSTNAPKPTAARKAEAPGTLTADANANQQTAETAPNTDTSTGTTADNSDGADGLPAIPPTEEGALPPLEEDPNLANVAANAETQPISSTTEPTTTTPPPKEVVATRELLSTQADTKTTEAAYDAAKAKYKVFTDQMNSANPYQYLDDPAWRARAQAAQDELNAAEAANKKAQSTYSASIQKLSIIKQGGQ